MRWDTAVAQVSPVHRGSSGALAPGAGGGAVSGSAYQPDTPAPKKLPKEPDPRCLKSAGGTAVSLGLDAAGASLFNGIRSIRSGEVLRSFSLGMASRAGETGSATVAGLANQAYERSSDLIVGGALQTAARPVLGVLSPAPFEAPGWYDVLRNFPVLGPGLRLGETIDVCLGVL